MNDPAHMLVRFWFQFEQAKQPTPTNIGCGVTAYNYDDALLLIKNALFAHEQMPPIIRVIEDVDISTLNQGHVVPNMGSIFVRGGWFP